MIWGANLIIPIKLLAAPPSLSLPLLPSLSVFNMVANGMLGKLPKP